MPLPKELMAPIDSVIAQYGTTTRDGWRDLNQVITAPNSEKIVMSRIYAQELLNRGFVIDTALEMHKPSKVPDADLGKYFEGARGRVMVVGIEKDAEERTGLIFDMIRAVGAKDTIFVMIGTRENVDNLFTAHPHLTNWFKNTVHLGEPTPEELEQQRKANIVAQWREMRDFDVTVGHAVVAPEKAAFPKKSPKPV